MKYGKRKMELEDRRETTCGRVGRKVGIGIFESMETWRNKIGKYQENWICGKYEIGKY